MSRWTCVGKITVKFSLAWFVWVTFHIIINENSFSKLYLTRAIKTDQSTIERSFCNTDWLTDQVITEWMTFSLQWDAKASADNTFWEAPQTSDKPAEWTPCTNVYFFAICVLCILRFEPSQSSYSFKSMTCFTYPHLVHLPLFAAVTYLSTVLVSIWLNQTMQLNG
jgi:hypothetical protein